MIVTIDITNEPYMMTVPLAWVSMCCGKAGYIARSGEGFAVFQTEE